jgi:hypothetical protein
VCLEWAYWQQYVQDLPKYRAFYLWQRRPPLMF